MGQIINAIYENGILKPVDKLHFREHEKLKLKVERKKNIVQETRGIIKVRNKKIAKK